MSVDVGDRIDRRLSGRADDALVLDRTRLSPTWHPPSPVGRGPALERLLDALDPVFDDALPAPVAVVGPRGSGTSATVSALFDALDDRLGERRTMATATRADGSVTWFVRLDARRVSSPFAFYRRLLSAISTEPVPDSGVGTATLRADLRDRLDRADRRAVIALDHHDEPGSIAYDDARDLLDPVADSVSTVAVGRRPPRAWAGATVELAPYRRQELVDVLTERASAGLVAGGIDHESIREIAGRSAGSAHDALAALFGSAVVATAGGAGRIDADALDAAFRAIPDDAVHVDRALALSATRRRALLALVDAETENRPIDDVAAAVAASTSLSPGTVRRYLYEFADRGVVERVPLAATGSGRGPSAVEPRFPTIVFRTLASAALETA